jgi:hypothetical protein
MQRHARRPASPAGADIGSRQTAAGSRQLAAWQQEAGHASAGRWHLWAWAALPSKQQQHARPLSGTAAALCVPPTSTPCMAAAGPRAGLTGGGGSSAAAAWLHGSQESLSLRGGSSSDQGWSERAGVAAGAGGRCRVERGVHARLVICAIRSCRLVPARTLCCSLGAGARRASEGC